MRSFEEVADSDDEDLIFVKSKSTRHGYDGTADTEYDSGISANTVTQPDEKLDPELEVNDHETDFHKLPGYGIDFITPTQRLSSHVDSGEDSTVIINSSTDRFLDGVVEEAEASSFAAEEMGGKSQSKKRASAEVEGIRSSSTKRVKTYGSSAVKSVSVSQAQSDFLDMIQPASRASSTESNNMISVEPRSHYSSTGSKSSSYQPYTPQHGFNNMQGLTASRSSMGNYQSFSVDPTELNKDFGSINPFGSASQISNAADLETDETRGISEIFKREQSTSQVDLHQAVIDEMQTSPEDAMLPPETMHAFEEPPKPSPPYSPISDAEVTNSIDIIAINVPALPPPVSAEELMPAPKKRGRKSQAKGIPDDMDELQMDEHLATRSARAGTTDSNISDLSHTTTTSRACKKLKKSKRPPPEESKKLPSSDLGLDNKAVIGLSPERYVPRPSRRRGRAGSETQPEPESTSIDTPAKGKRGRKPKAKKGKAKVMDEDQAEIVEVEVKEVTMDEDPAEVDEAVEESTIEESNSRRKPNISIDVPVLPRADEDEDMPVAPEPKKRGRKRKQPVKEPVPEPEEENAEPSVPLEKDSADESKALAEKDANAKIAKIDAPEMIEKPADATADKENATIKSAKSESKSLDTNPAITPAKSTSPVKSLSTSSIFNQRARIGLSKRHSIPSLLSKINRNKEAPKVTEKKEKLNKRQLEEREQERIAKEEAEAEGREYVPLNVLRNKDGSLVEWDF